MQALGNMILFLRTLTAAVWLVFGIVFKVLNVVPRHRMIVGSILGDSLAAPVALLVGAAEAAIGLWILSGFRPRACAAVQTIAIVTMNVLELAYARHLLLAPVPMVLANIGFLVIVWYCALKAPAAPAAS